MFPDLEFIKTCLNGLRNRIEQVEKQIKTWVVSFVRTNRPNWAQNDPNALDYVKGRTHWEEEDIIDISGTSYIITGFTSNILTVTHDEIPFELGQIWSVQGGPSSVYTNVEVQRSTDGVLYLGEPTVSNVPFYITKDTATINSLWQSMSSASSLTLTCASGSVTIRTVHSLNPKFLPTPTSNAIGAVKADSAKTTDIQPVRLGTDGKLYSSGIPIFTTSGTGSAYTANVPEITELVDGMLVVMIPHVSSASKKPTLNINGLGAYEIRRFLSSQTSTHTNIAGIYIEWLKSGVPVILMYKSGLWFACNLAKPDVQDLFGKVSISHGGTGLSFLNKGSYLVGNDISQVQLKTPSEVLADIGAIPVPATASVGQVITVKAVDADGKPTEWETADMPSGGSMRWQKIKEITLAEQTNGIVIGEDDNGVSVADYNPIAMKVEFHVPADSTQTNANGAPWIYPSATCAENDIRAIGSISSWKTVTRRQVEFFIGDIDGIFAGGNYNSQLVPNPSNKPNITVMDGVKLYINSTGDHWPVGTIVSLEVLSERA